MCQRIEFLSGGILPLLLVARCSRLPANRRRSLTFRRVCHRDAPSKATGSVSQRSHLCACVHLRLQPMRYCHSAALTSDAVHTFSD